MTTTALRALTVAALSAAVLTSTLGTAQADETTDPCFRQDIECYGPNDGETLDPDPSWTDDTNVTVCMIQPWLCEPEVQPEPVVDTAPVPSTAPTAGTQPRPVPAPRGQQDPIAEHAADQATTLESGGVPLWVLQDKSAEAVRDIMARCTYALMAP